MRSSAFLLSILPILRAFAKAAPVLFLTMACTHSVFAQVFEYFGLSVPSSSANSGSSGRIENLVVGDNVPSLKLVWGLKNKNNGIVNGAVNGAVSCSLSGDTLGQVTGSYGKYQASVPKDMLKTLGSHSFSVTCTDNVGEIESRTATLMVEKQYEILDFYVDAASLPVQPESNITFRWSMTPTDLRCFVEERKSQWWHLRYPLSKDEQNAWAPGTTEFTMKAPAEPKEYAYRLKCDIPKKVDLPTHDPVNSELLKISVTDSQLTPGLPVFEAFWLSSIRMTTAQSSTLNWDVQDADSCTASGNWSGIQNTSGNAVLSDIAVGSYDYTLTCQNAAGVSSRSVTLAVTDLPAAKITRLELNGIRKKELNGDIKDTIQTGEPARLRWAASHAASCTVSGSGWSDTQQPVTTAGIVLPDSAINAVGEHHFTLTCVSAEGGASDSQTVSLTVLPADQITQFSIDATASTLEPGGDLVLRWTTQPADLACVVRTINKDWPQKEQGLAEFVLPPNHGQYTYELRCGDRPVTQTVVAWLQDNAPPGINLTGQYFGRQTQIMAFGDQAPGSATSAGMGYANMLRVDGSGRHYNVLGENLSEAYWLWDFDKGKIHLGGSNLRAMDLFFPPYRLYAPDRVRRETVNGAPAQFYPETDPPLSEHLGTFEDRGNGLYAVKFNLQIFFSLADYPLAQLELLMRISQNPDGTLRITTLDEHPDGKTMFDDVNPYLAEGERVPVKDGIPGVLLPAYGDVYPVGHPRAGEPMDNRGFPMRISPWFFSDRMVKVESALAKNGVPKTIMEVLRLDTELIDQDDDGIYDAEEIGNNWALPRQSNLDGIYDLLKPREFVGKPHFVGQIVLGNGERVVLHRDDLGAQPFLAFENYVPVAFWRELLPHWLQGGGDHPYFYTFGGDNPRLPLTHDKTGKFLRYDLGTLWVYSIKEGTNSTFVPFNIYFANGVPDGLKLYDFREVWGVASTMGQRFAGFAEVPWEPLLDAEGNHDGKTIRVLSVPTHRPIMGPYSARLALAHTETNRVVAPFAGTQDPVYRALLDTAAGYSYTPPPVTLEPSIASFAPSLTPVALGESVRLRWQVLSADACTLVYEGESLSVPLVGNHTVTPDHLGTHQYELTCTLYVPPKPGTTGRTYETRRTTTVQVVNAADIGDNRAANLIGVWEGEHRATMRGCPGACVAGQEVTLGNSIKNARWVWDFDNQTVQITGTTLTVGFNYEVQSPGNQGQGEARLTAPFANNGDGTYTVDHGFQIYNPGVGNPRADTSTTFGITVDTENTDRISIVTLDSDGDGIPGKQVVGVFPMTIQPAFDGAAFRDTTSTAGDGILDSVKLRLRLNPDAINGDTDGDGVSDRVELGAFYGDDPRDTDGDGIIDALEPGDDAKDPQIIGGLALLDGIPGRKEEGLPLAGTTARVRVAGDWRFAKLSGTNAGPGGDTGLLALSTGPDNMGAIPEVTLGDAGLDYQHGFVQVRLRSTKLLPASGSGGGQDQFDPMAAPVADPVTLTFTYQAQLPPAGTLMVYATQRVDGRERYTKMDSGWRRVDDHTLEVTLRDNSLRDMASENGYLRFGIAPVANTLGGYNERSGNASGGGGGSPALWMLLALLSLVGVQRVRQTRTSPLNPRAVRIPASPATLPARIMSSPPEPEHDPNTHSH